MGRWRLGRSTARWNSCAQIFHGTWQQDIDDHNPAPSISSQQDSQGSENANFFHLPEKDSTILEQNLAEGATLWELVAVPCGAKRGV
jgi:hypothetical protein